MLAMLPMLGDQTSSIKWLSVGAHEAARGKTLARHARAKKHLTATAFGLKTPLSMWTGKTGWMWHTHS